MKIQLFHFHFWKIILLDIQFLVDWIFFSFHYFEYVTHCLLASTVSDEKSVFKKLLGVPLYMTSHLCLAAFTIFTVSLAFILLILVCLEFLWIHPTWNLLYFMDVQINLSSIFRSLESLFLQIYFFLLFSFSSLLLYFYYTYVDVLNGVPHFSDALYIFFLLFELNTLYQFIFTFADSIFYQFKYTVEAL